MTIVSLTGRRKVLAPVRPNLGIEAAYRGKLDALIIEMQASLIYWLRAQYRENPPELASDASPAADLEAEMRRLGARWQSRFDAMAPEIGKWFATSAASRSDATLKAIMSRAGWTVKFQPTRTWNDVRQATIKANVELIKSIPAECLTQVQGITMRAVQEGRQLSVMTDELVKQFGVTRRRAEFISLDQNNKATAAINRVRQIELGLFQAQWLHSGGGREPRPSHVAFSEGRLGGPLYDVRKGAFIDGEWILPGTKPRCRCVSRAVLPGLGD
jgi:hypothetical protein